MKRILTIGMLAFAFVPCVSLFADTHYVVPAGTAGNIPSAPYTSWATAANSIADALDATTAGDTVLVQKGTYNFTARYAMTKDKHHGTTIRSYDPDNGGAINSEETIIDGSAVDPVASPVWNSPGGVVFAHWDSANGPIVDGFTFRNSRSGAMKFVYVQNSKILNCRFLNNTNNFEGGAVCNYAADKTVVSNCLFVGNSATGKYGGACFMRINSTDSSYRTKVLDCIFMDNESNLGGAIYSYGHCDVSRCVFNGNTGLVTGGGAIAMQPDFVVSDCTFTGKTEAQGSHYGHAIYIGQGSDGDIISNCMFTNLAVQGSYSVAAYGLIDIYNANLTMENCTFQKVTNCRRYLGLRSNTRTVKVRNCLFTDIENSATVVFANSGDSTGTMSFENCTIYAPEKNIMEGASGKESHVEFANCILSCARPTTVDKHVRTVTNCYVGGDPRFVDASAGDFRLLRRSPCRDQGNLLDWMTAASVDLLGNPRVVTDGRTLAQDPSALPDLGCYEFQDAPLGFILSFQ